MKNKLPMGNSFPTQYCPSPLPIALASKTLPFKLLHQLSHTQKLQFPFGCLLLLSLLSLYLLTSKPSPSFLDDPFRRAVAFVALLLIFITLALLHFLSTNLPISFLVKRRTVGGVNQPVVTLSGSNYDRPYTSSSQYLPVSSTHSKPLSPVVWSIGSEAKSEKKVNSGSWVQVFSNGDVYEGDFHRGKCSGSGTYCYYMMSGKYEGDWINGKCDGYGVETWAKGSGYRGQYREGLRHGVGVCRFYTGDGYAGEWCNGQFHGCGVYTSRDGSKYVGEFKYGVKHGLGHYNYRNGDVYAGQYFADKMHGFGVYKYANGHQYEGSWHEGVRQGLGIYTFRNGDSQIGHWHNGILDNTKYQIIEHVSSITMSSCKVANVVEEARRAAERAEKAYDLQSVDERVNKAVAVAMKAANAARVAAVKAVQRQVTLNCNYNEISSLPTP
ncbi:hypothetical protein Ancab_032919 [Ancistrocladus abbreviatus]